MSFEEESDKADKKGTKPALAIDKIMRKMGKNVEESSEISGLEESGGIPVVESEQIIGDGLVSKAKAKEASSHDDDFSEDYEESQESKAE